MFREEEDLKSRTVNLRVTPASAPGGIPHGGDASVVELTVGGVKIDGRMITGLSLHMDSSGSPPQLVLTLSPAVLELDVDNAVLRTLLPPCKVKPRPLYFDHGERPAGGGDRSRRLPPRPPAPPVDKKAAARQELDDWESSEILARSIASLAVPATSMSDGCPAGDRSAFLDWKEEARRAAEDQRFISEQEAQKQAAMAQLVAGEALMTDQVIQSLGVPGGLCGGITKADAGLAPPAPRLGPTTRLGLCDAINAYVIAHGGLVPEVMHVTAAMEATFCSRGRAERILGVRAVYDSPEFWLGAEIHPVSTPAPGGLS